MSHSQEQIKCENCLYFQRHQGRDDGTCHIRSPQVVTTINVKGVGIPGTGWPTVQKNSWCGEFKEKPVKPSKKVIDVAKKVMNAQLP